MSGFVSWWRRPDQYGELSSYLEARGMALAMRLRVAGIAASLSIIVAASIWSPSGPEGTVAVTCAAVASLIGAAGALLWMVGWPSRRHAIAFAMGSTTAIAVAALAQSAPVAGLLGCTALAALAVHIAFFYAAPVVVYNVLCAAAVASIEAYRLIPSAGLSSALAAWWLMVSVNLAAPVGLHMTSRIIGPDVVLADRDPLTGLWNRRAFLLRAEQLLRAIGDEGGVFVVAVVDLDRFKQLNDRCGHLVGDQALAAVARALLESCSEDAVVGRIGGEEFGIADTSLQPRHSHVISQAMCEAIAALPFDVTASVGVASIDVCAETALGSPQQLLSRMASGADAAMYAAKAAGGNRARHCD
ncbi:GGDEF domain-containing protein [Mycobacterium sp. AT1]|uniref:sensor domain-containing diguanylate cyclase n=1 Tax=Mycobacterium sp. AT1 TaxID=1961706 RepID=UPI0009AC9EAE|nr:GGDEF domain-containing protein [Mycobacterium sp. AT1]OPX12387.1 hypothetical protein B1790_04315 [Mycobacterium sp. AT1]